MTSTEPFDLADCIVFTAYGVHVEVRTDSPALLRRLLPLLPVGWKPASTGGAARVYSVIGEGGTLRPQDEGFSLLYGNGKRICRTVDKEALLDAFESDVTTYVAEHAPHRVFVHAGVVGWRGRAILIPGRSFSGKTTLVTELVRAGATFYSDECAVLDKRGHVHPYPRALHIRENGNRRPTSQTIEDLGGVAGTKPLPVGLVLMSRYKAGGKWRPRPLSAGEGTLGLFANTFSARRQPEAALATLKQVTMRAQVLKGVRGEARQVIESLMSDFI